MFHMIFFFLCLFVWINRAAHFQREKHCILCWYGTFNILDTIFYFTIYEIFEELFAWILIFHWHVCFLSNAQWIIIHLFCCSKYRWSIFDNDPVANNIWKLKFKSGISAHRNPLYECNCHCCVPPKSFQRDGKKTKRNAW